MKPRLQFSVATMFWLTLCVATFFAGRHWDAIAKAAAIAASAMPVQPIVVPPSPPFAMRTPLQLAAGDSMTISTGGNGSIWIVDPTIVGIVHNNPTSFTVTAKRSGKTEIHCMESYETIDVSVE